MRLRAAGAFGGVLVTPLNMPSRPLPGPEGRRSGAALHVGPKWSDPRPHRGSTGVSCHRLASCSEPALGDR